MTQTILDSQAIAQFELDQYLERQSQGLAPEFEIDRVEDPDFGSLHRLWKDMALLGTFYHTKAVNHLESAIAEIYHIYKW